MNPDPNPVAPRHAAAQTAAAFSARLAQPRSASLAARLLIASARRRMPIGAVALTAWDPSHDVEERGVDVAARLVAALA